VKTLGDGYHHVVPAWMGSDEFQSPAGGLLSHYRWWTFYKQIDEKKRIPEVIGSTLHRHLLTVMQYILFETEMNRL
jgi:hypothetical protein